MECGTPGVAAACHGSNGLVTTSPRAAAATPCAQSARRCTAFRVGVIGSSASLAYTSNERGGTFTHEAEADYLDDGPQKWSRTGRRPLLAAELQR